mgnify:CR=1 FL=1
MSAQIFIDADNVKPEIGFKVIEKFSNLYTVDKVNIIGNETTLSSKYLEASNRYNIQNCFYGKNSADTWLCTEIAKTIFENPAVDVIIIVSSDRDFLAAIKLATDRKRKVIFVSEGNGHKNLKALLYDLRINPDLIELVDFQTDLTINSPVKKKGVTNPMKIISPNQKLNKIKAVCMKNSNLKKFFTQNEAKFQLVKLKRNGGFIEIPFFEGINFSTLTNILMALKVIPNGRTLMKIFAENNFEIVNNCVYFENVEGLSEQEKNPFNDVINYFTAHSAETKNILIKCEDKLHEVPFVNGISLVMFSRLLKGYEIADDAEKIKKIIADSFLSLRSDNRIYFQDEETISADLKSYLQKLPSSALEFIRKNEDKLKIVAIAHNDSVHKVPFVEGIHLSIFVNMLRTLNIFGKNTNSSKVLTANGFKIQDNLVYKKGSE